MAFFDHRRRRNSSAPNRGFQLRRRLGVESLERRELLAIATGDFNGDGFADTATSTPAQNFVEVSYGNRGGTERWTQDSANIKDELETGDQFGAAVATGDFNGDGFDDLAIGAPGEDRDGLVDVGIVHVLYGSDDGLTSRENSIWFQNKSDIEGSGEANDRFGSTLQVSDVNRDGFDDLTIGVPGDTTSNRLFGSDEGLVKRNDALVANDTSGGGSASLSIRDVSVTEGNAGTVRAVFLVVRQGSRDGTITVDFATAENTAEQGVDYVGQTGQLSFGPNVTVRAVSITINGDTADEQHETFFVNLSNASGATLSDAQGRGTIRDDDDGTSSSPVLAVSDIQVTEGDSGTVNAVFTVTLSPASQQPVTVNFATANSTAAAPQDFTAASGQLSFAAGQTSKLVTVAVRGDTSDESNERFFVNLSGASGATIADAQAIGTIVDNDDEDEPPPPPTGGVVHVQATVQTDDAGGSADDPAIWIHPTDPSRSLIIGTNKESLQVFDLAGNVLQVLNDGEMNNVDLRYNFPLGGQSVALVVASNRSNDTMTFYKVNPTTLRLESVGSIDPDLSVYGIGMYHSAETGKFYAFVNSKSGVVEQWELFAGANGQIAGTQVRSFDVGTQPEGVVADDELGFVYVGEENVALWKYGAEPGDGSTRTQVDADGGGRLTADIEGVTIYYKSDGTGYLIVSSQGSNQFAVYRREGNNAYLGSFDIVAGGGIDGVTSTDGIDVTNVSLGSAFPQGLFIAQDDDTNFKLVPWQSISVGFNPDLSIDTSYNPRA